MARAQTRSEITQSELTALGSISGDEGLADILVRVNQVEDLAPSEELRFFTHSELIYRHWQNRHYQGRHGLYDENEIKKHVATMEWVMSQSPYLVKYWFQQGRSIQKNSRRK